MSASGTRNSSIKSRDNGPAVFEIEKPLAVLECVERVDADQIGPSFGIHVIPSHEY
jgi:hypothetical protein